MASDQASKKPIFMATHPRACSTAFERVFMTRRKSLATIHEPFGDAFYYGPERMGSRFEEDERAREESGFADSTFKMILDRIEQEGAELNGDLAELLSAGHEPHNSTDDSQGKRVFIKDITYYIVPPEKKPGQPAPSLQEVKRGVGTTTPPGEETTAGGTPPHDSAVDLESPPKSPPRSPPFPYETPVNKRNPTVVPREILEKFQFTFLIRHPRNAIPSYYRCCIPPLVERTGFNPFMPSEAGYEELRRLFDYCKDTGLVGPAVTGQDNAGRENPAGQPQITVIDADDLLDDPEGILRQYCESINLDFRDDMLNWDSEEAHEFAREQFEKWDGFHDDAIGSRDLKPRQHKHAPKSDEQLYSEWVEKYGQEAADMIKQTVKDNVETYEYLKQYAIRV
ncbi:uncharacterized protein LTR77_008258 [Saxophila tyrrhenica]|uniref:P-loop containing nucleoside triphosphate hydrolase protein n=1 Tax=Saxophila tyrrhenica TaxID=1690608 RepID=A0AAV9P2X8_9PEZI|nr:hypothetical protein LTR77_008258 [Saxophila tyrrhenica]